MVRQKINVLIFFLCWEPIYNTLDMSEHFDKESVFDS